MTKKLYVIPGWNEKCSLAPYLTLANLAKSKGYEATCIEINWKSPLSGQTFDITEGSIIFGFSLGAILGRLITQESSCKHLILASSTVMRNLEGSDHGAYVDLLGKDFVEDIIINITEANKAEKQTTLYGDQEGESSDVLVQNTGHELSDEYLKVIGELL